MGAQGGGRDEGRRAESGAPSQLDVQPVRCNPPGIQQMPAHHTHHHHHHHHHHLYNIDPDAGELVPPQPLRPRHQPAPPRAEGGAGADGLGGGGAGHGIGAAGTGAARGAGAGGRGRPAMGPGLGRGPGPSGGRGPPPGGGGVRVVVLGQPGDHQGAEEPALRCCAPPERRRKPRGTPWGDGQPQRTMTGSSGQ